MDGYLILKPTQIPMETCIDLSQLVEVRKEPHMIEQDVFDNVKGPGGGKAKRKKVGTQMVPTGAFTVHISTTVQGYGLTFNNPNHANVMYAEILLAIRNGGGECQDLSPEEQKKLAEQQEEAKRAAAERAAKSQENAEERAAAEEASKQVNVSSENQSGGITAGEVNVEGEAEPPAETAEVVGISDAAAAAVEADGYDADPTMYNNEYTCVNCDCEYTFECADPEFEIACPECETNNKPEGLLA